MTSSGYLTNDYTQSVHIEDKTVTEVLVAEGDTVAIGDPLLVYDTTDIQLQIEMQQLELQGVNNDITLAQRELDKLRKITPRANPAKTAVTPSSPVKTTTKKPEPKKESVYVALQVQRKDGDAYNYIDAKAKPYEGKGTPEKPYRFLCTPECYVMGSYLNQLIKKEQVASFEIWSGNSYKEGTMMSCWTVDGSEQKSVDKDSKWLVATQEELEDETLEEEETEEEEEEDEEEDDSEEDSTEDIPTVDELNKDIREKESELKNLGIDKKKAELELEKLTKSKDNATVLASINGVVVSVHDPQSPPDDGSAFLEIAGSEGIYVKGEISELQLDQIEVGQEITVNCWSTGQMYQAEITEISQYPSESSSGGYYGEGNPNVSNYPFTAYIKDAAGLSNGEYVDLSITPVSTGEEMNSIYIEKAYVREENGQSYVLKVGEDDRLVKQYVQTGKTLYGSSIEIKAGISEADRIAFPYGKTAKEGIKAVESSDY